MLNKTSFRIPPGRPGKLLASLVLAVVSAVTVGVVIGAPGDPSPPPAVALSSEPLYMNGAKTKANLTLALSVERPLVGQVYRDEFDKTKEYVGYFDSKSCYRHVPSNGDIGAYFDWTGAVNGSGSCGGGGFNGNFMNWATSSAVDILRYGLTGGNRVIDDNSGAGKTVVERAWLPDDFYRNASLFSEKVLPAALVQDMIENVAANKIGNNDMYIYNCRDRVYFAKSRDTVGACGSPFGVADDKSDQLAGPGNASNGETFYEVRNLVCDPNSATNRLMLYDDGSRQWKGLCFRYPSGKYKPVGQMQMHAENLRLSVFSYLQDDSRARYGGVMRSPLKYVGPKAFDASFNAIAGTNPRTEWDPTWGVLKADPQNGDATYGNQGYPLSGAINYINKFGTLNPTYVKGQGNRYVVDPTSVGKYKRYDPVSELYYEALRYLQGKTAPTAKAVLGFDGTAASVKALKENFPAYSTWTDPFDGFTDASSTGNSCLRNSILTVADVFTHSDREVPGNDIAESDDAVRAADTNPNLDARFWTKVVGSFESNHGVEYTDSEGRTRTASNIVSPAPYSWLENADEITTGAGTTPSNLTQQGNSGGSYYMAGMAYWANTQSFRTDFPKARVKTLAIDVNENGASENAAFRRSRQLYLAAKYGGFDDNATGLNNPGHTGNPYINGTNTLWLGSNGDAKNYFLASNARKFLDSLSEAFARVVEETGSIAGGAISTQRLTVGEAAAVFQARFNPVANYWSGRVLKYPITLTNDQTSVNISATPTWDAGQVLTTLTSADHGVSRNIVIGPAAGRQGTDLPSAFLWSELATAHQTALNTTLAGLTDTLGSDRLDYIRGDRRKEISVSNPTAPFRPRDLVLGDVINSALVYKGAPSTAITEAAYKTFYDANKSRAAVVYVNANDGMLHAFYDSNGQEAFAYIPGFVSSKLSHLPDLDYSHEAIADATPVVAEAKVGSDWKTVLVSGVGGGGQGVFALNVTNPASFTSTNAMWEFTDRDHPAMGNVIGQPQIVKVRTNNIATGVTPTYKWYAMVASGVNNYTADGYAHSGGNPSLFILDLAMDPSQVTWQEGVNFWRIELPQADNTRAKALGGFSVVNNVNTGALETVYAGDLQGNVWKLDFSQKGVNSSNLSTTMATNLTNFTSNLNSKPLFIAKTSSGILQPITGEPAVVNAFGGNKLVVVGTGKFLEVVDTSVPIDITASMYGLLDQSQIISGRSALQSGTVSTSGTVTIPSFVYGSPTVASPNLRMGWYFDFNAALGERQVSDISSDVPGKVIFGSLYPTKGSCGEGGGRLYTLNSLTGNGISAESEVGILAAPLVLEIGNATLGTRDTSGKRLATQRLAIITQGSRGMKVLPPPAGSTSYTYSYWAHWLSWRQINNYQEMKNN